MSDAEGEPEIGIPGREEESRRLLEELYFGRRRERSPLHEMAAEGEPREVRIGVRKRLAWTENESYINGRFPKSLYPLQLMTQELVERRDAIDFIYPLGLVNWPEGLASKKDKETGEITKEGYDLLTEESQEKREELVGTLDSAYNEALARTGLLEKMREQDVFLDDVGNYLEVYFLRYGKERLPSHFYGVILRSPETVEGFVPFGRKVETAFDAFKEIGEGKAKITLPNGREKILPNIFSLAPNRGLMQLSLEKYIMPKLADLRGEVDRTKLEEFEDQGALKGFETRDDLEAAILAFGLFRHMDMGIKYAMGIGETGKPFDPETATPEDLKELGMEMPFITGDHAKMLIETRRWTEWGRGQDEDWGERREHPRPAGAPMSFGCYPILITSMPEIIVTEMVVDQEIRNQIRNEVGHDNFKVGKKNTIKMSVHDRCFKSKRKIEVTVNPETEKEEREVEITYQPKTLAEIKWDDVEIINIDSEGDWLEVAYGVRSDAFEIPKKLQGYYAYVSIFKEVIRTDFPKQLSEIMTTGKLRGMSKKIDIAMKMLGGAYNLSESTKKKLNNYIRAVFIGSLGAAASETSDSDRLSLEKGWVATQYEGTQKGGDVSKRLLEAARVSGFLPVMEDGRLDSQYEALAEKIRKGREPILPKDSGIFEEDELKELKPLYPLGL